MSTIATKASGKISQQTLTVGLDLGDRSGWYCVLDESGADGTGLAGEHDSESDAGSVWGNAAQAGGSGKRDALAVGEPATERVGK